MKKLFFFKSDRRGKESEKNTLKSQLMKSQSEDSDGQALRRSRSMSSSAFLVDGTIQHRHRNHSSRFRCFTPESQSKKAEYSQMYKVHNDSSASLSTCSSNVSSQVLDRYIDGEVSLERSKPKNGSSSSSYHTRNLSGSIIGKRLPKTRVQSPSPLSDNKDKRRQPTRMNFSSTEYLDASPRKLARSVIERLSHTHGKSMASSEKSNLDVFANLPLADDDDERYEDQELFLDGVSSDANSEVERKYKEAEKRVKVLSEELEQQKFLPDCDFDIRQMQEDRLALAFEVLTLLRSQMVEREAKTDWELQIKRLEKEKSELQFGLEKELDRRSSEWTSKIDSFKVEEKRLRERVRELAEHNVSLQRDVSTFHEKETERIDMIRRMDEAVSELSVTTEEMREENLYLRQKLSKLEEITNGATEDYHCARRNFEEKDMECKELNRTVTNLVRTCREQEKTIQGLRDSLSEEIKKQPSESYEEQVRLTGVEFSLRKELESMKLEADSLRREMNGVKGNEDVTLKLESEVKMRVCQLQDQGISMLDESTQLCYKFLRFIKETIAQLPESNNGLSEQFLIESEMSVNGIRRGTESLERSLQTVTSLLVEKSNEMASHSESSSSSASRHSEEESLRAELRAETLITRLLREKLYSKEQEIEQLQAEVAAGVRGNEVLQREIRNTLDNISRNNHQLKEINLQMVKKDENMNRLQINLQEAARDMANMKAALPKVLEERDQLWKQMSECRDRNMDLESEKEMLNKKVEKLEEDTLYKEGQITILKDTLSSSKHFDLLSSPEFSYNDFLVQ